MQLAGEYINSPFVLGKYHVEYLLGKRLALPIPGGARYAQALPRLVSADAVFSEIILASLRPPFFYCAGVQFKLRGHFFRGYWPFAFAGLSLAHACSPSSSNMLAGFRPALVVVLRRLFRCDCNAENFSALAKVFRAAQVHLDMDFAMARISESDNGDVNSQLMPRQRL